MFIIIGALVVLVVIGIYVILALTDDDFRAQDSFEEKRARRREQDLNSYRYQHKD